MLVRIASPDNARVRLVRKLHTRKGRNTSKKFAAEGINLISEIITLGLRPDFIMVSDKWMDDDTCSDERRELILGCMQSDSITVCEVPASLFEQITDAGNGVGVLAVLDMIKQDASVLDDLGPDDNILVLDRIQDPGNMGTMIRTAVAAGYKAIIASHGTVDIYSSKVLRSTAGMIFQIPVLYASDEDDLDQMLKRSGKKKQR
jgi:TrmH family RNA methyltransferase